MSLSSSLYYALPLTWVRALDARRFADELAAFKYPCADVKRVYQYHIRKTAGTSLIMSFLALGQPPAHEVYDALIASGRSQLASPALMAVAWNRRKLQGGAFHFGFSHWPAYQLKLPRDTFTFTCLRDPLKRVISYYRMLRASRMGLYNHPLLHKELEWYADDFDVFLDRVPSVHLRNQLHMFSPSANAAEALEALRSVNMILFTETLVAGRDALGRRLGLNLPEFHEKKFELDIDISNPQRARLQAMLASEYELIDQVRQLPNAQA